MSKGNIVSLLLMLAGYIGLEAVQSIGHGSGAPALVSCGCHDAPTCSQCGSQPYLCNGDCVWNGSKCTFRKDACPEGWTNLKTGCYRFLPEQGTAHNFDEAKRSCGNEGGYLVEIDNEYEQDALHKFFKDSQVSHMIMNNWTWIGGVFNDSKWIWNHSGREMIFTAWASGKPTVGENKTCLVASHDFLWENILCWPDYLNRKALCEYQEPCSEPFAVAGPCEMVIPRWSYNQKTGRCEKFTYGGCGGNFNNFETFEECANICQYKTGGKMDSCYFTGQCDVTQCLPGYKCCFDGFCCPNNCPPTIEDTITSLVPSDLQCKPWDCEYLQCPQNSECCFGRYCCPYICPKIEEDAANSTLPVSTFISCNSCDDACEQGANYFKNHICDLLPWPLDDLCDVLIGSFSVPACKKFCGIIC